MNFYDDLHDDILNDKKEELDGFSFSLTSDFRIIDKDDGFFFEFHKLFKRSYKGYEKQVEKIMENSPLSINEVYNIELSEFKMNKLYKGRFIINYYSDNSYDIFLKDYEII
jgi:hypothetical protein